MLKPRCFVRECAIGAVLLIVNSAALADDAAATTLAQAATPTGTVVEEAPVEMPVIEVIGTGERRRTLPGSGQVIERDALDLSRVMTTNEALRKAAGVNVRDEEGFGLRPNIGIRGLNPTRSTKVLLLEDGIPLAYAPYGDNASYYHPPVDRFDRIEILKGAGQNIYGPQTIGGVINYITPAPPADFGGGVQLTGGNREYRNGHGFIGGRNMLLDYVRKEGSGARDNIHSDLNDVNYKAVVAIGSRQAVTARANYYSEDSQNTYSGLTDAEYANFGARYNPFKNDEFVANREGVSFTHELAFGGDNALTTNFYSARFNRHWWRQASTTSDTQCNTSVPTFSADRVAGNAVNPDACQSIQGRLREYYTYGVEPRLRVGHGLFGLANELETGIRVHYETQDRVQKNGASATARDGTVVEDNERLTNAYSTFVQNRFGFGAASVTPGVRVEHVQYERTNRGNGASAEGELTEVLPSLGATFSAGSTTLFAGVHRGFSPPRTEDTIQQGGTFPNQTETFIDLEAEKSWNYELGARAKPRFGLTLETTAFLNDFERQIAVGSIAGGSTPLAVGETRYAGAELLGRVEIGRLLDSTHNPFVELAYTWLPVADQESSLTSPTTGTVVAGSVAGNRLPYAPENLVTASVGYNHIMGFDTRLEAVYVDEQFSNFANTETPDGTGQIGVISGYTVWNAAANYRVTGTGFGVFVTAKNLFDKVYIVDRTRGILPGAPRLVQAGVEYTF